MKHCHRCNTTKPASEFYKNKSRPDGLSGYCRACNGALTTEWKRKNPERVKEMDVAYAQTDAGRAANARKWSKKKLRSDFKVVNNTRSARYRARKISGTPGCLTREDMAEIRGLYGLASYFTAMSGGFVRYDVDHIIPLAGDGVCGLHAPWNLRVMRSDLNQSKGNKVIL